MAVSYNIQPECCLISILMAMCCFWVAFYVCQGKCGGEVVGAFSQALLKSLPACASSPPEMHLCMCACVYVVLYADWAGLGCSVLCCSVRAAIPQLLQGRVFVGTPSIGSKPMQNRKQMPRLLAWICLLYCLL